MSNVIITPSDMYSTPNFARDQYPLIVPGFGYGGQGFAQPNNIADLKVWYKASDFDSYGNGVEVVSWADLSGNGYNCFARGAAGDRATVSRNSINGTMTSVSNGSSKKGLLSGLNTAFLTSKITWTTFQVVKPTFTGATNGWFTMFVTGNVTETRWEQESLTGLLQLTYGNVAAYQNAGGLYQSQWNYFVMVNTAGVITTYLNGNTTAGVWLQTPSVTGPTSNPTDILIADGTNTGPITFTGSIAEAGVYNRALTIAEIALLTNYMRTRYGLA